MHEKRWCFCEKVYFTAIYRCEQGLSDSLCLADVVPDKMKVDFPNLKMFMQNQMSLLIMETMT